MMLAEDRLCCPDNFVPDKNYLEEKLPSEEMTLKQSPMCVRNDSVNLHDGFEMNLHKESSQVDANSNVRYDDEKRIRPRSESNHSLDGRTDLDKFDTSSSNIENLKMSTTESNGIKKPTPDSSLYSKEPVQSISSLSCFESSCLCQNMEPSKELVPENGVVSSHGETQDQCMVNSTVQKTSEQRINHALERLRTDLMALREQDLQLLKQLIHINDSIRRLKRSHWMRTSGRAVSCDLLGSSCNLMFGGLGSISSGPRRVTGLARQHSEPGARPGWLRRTSTLTSSSSFETIDDDDEDQEDEMEDQHTTTASTPDQEAQSTSSPTPITPYPSPSPPSLPPAAQSSTTSFLHKDPWNGQSSFSEILKRNVRFWKWSVGKEHSGTVVGHPCVL